MSGGIGRETRDRRQTRAAETSLGNVPILRARRRPRRAAHDQTFQRRVGSHSCVRRLQEHAPRLKTARVHGVRRSRLDPRNAWTDDSENGQQAARSLLSGPGGTVFPLALGAASRHALRRPTRAHRQSASTPVGSGRSGRIAERVGSRSAPRLGCRGPVNRDATADLLDDARRRRIHLTDDCSGLRLRLGSTSPHSRRRASDRRSRSRIS